MKLNSIDLKTESFTKGQRVAHYLDKHAHRGIEKFISRRINKEQEHTIGNPFGNLNRFDKTLKNMSRS